MSKCWFCDSNMTPGITKNVQVFVSWHENDALGLHNFAKSVSCVTTKWWWTSFAISNAMASAVAVTTVTPAALQWRQSFEVRPKLGLALWQWQQLHLWRYSGPDPSIKTVLSMLGPALWHDNNYLCSVTVAPILQDSTPAQRNTRLGRACEQNLLPRRSAKVTSWRLTSPALYSTVVRLTIFRLFECRWFSRWSWDTVCPPCGINSERNGSSYESDQGWGMSVR